MNNGQARVVELKRLNESRITRQLTHKYYSKQKVYLVVYGILVYMCS